MPTAKSDLVAMHMFITNPPIRSSNRGINNLMLREFVEGIDNTFGNQLF
jgi:hypothetical protein